VAAERDRGKLVAGEGDLKMVVDKRDREVSLVILFPISNFHATDEYFSSLSRLTGKVGQAGK
jgi:hypothetical protein